MTVSADSRRDEMRGRINRAEAEFSAGDLCRAAELLRAALSAGRPTPQERAQILNDLAVIASTGAGSDEAEAHLLAAVACDPGYEPALENFAAWCAGTGDLVQATHWARRAAQADPAAPAGWRRLASLLCERRRYSEAREALQRAGALGDEVSAELHEIEGRCSARPPEPSARGSVSRVLIVVDYFHPSVGGSERLAEAAGGALQQQGMTVEVATRRLDQRSAREHRSMLIHEVDGDAVRSLHELLTDRHYDAMLIFSAPTAWPLIASLSLPEPRPRIIAVPCINAENSASLRADSHILGTYAQLLSTAEVVGFSSHSGPDVRLCEDLGIHGVYVPNASELVATPASPSPTAALRSAGPVLLSVGNMWPEKNHAGLVRSLRPHRGDWQLAMIGDASPAAPQTAAEVRRMAHEDPRIHLLGPARSEQVAAAMDDAQVLLLPSLAEATPLVLLEAMSRRLPWIATPTCGAAHDHAGGLVLPLALFGEGIDFLLGNARAARKLGDAGRAHWQGCYTWDVLGPRYAQILRGERAPDLPAPVHAQADTEAVRQEFYDGRPLTAVSRGALT